MVARSGCKLFSRSCRKVQSVICSEYSHAHAAKLVVGVVDRNAVSISEINFSGFRLPVPGIPSGRVCFCDIRSVLVYDCIQGGRAIAVVMVFHIIEQRVVCQTVEICCVEQEVLSEHIPGVCRKVLPPAQ